MNHNITLQSTSERPRLRPTERATSASLRVLAWLFLLLLPFQAHGQPTSAQKPPGADTAALLANLEAQLLERAPALAQANLSTRAALSRVTPAGALPDPMLEVMLQDVGVVSPGPMSMASAQVRQALPRARLRQAEKDSMQTEASQLALETLTMETQLVLELRTTVARLYQLDQALLAIQDSLELLSLAHGTALARLTSGTARASSALRIISDAEMLRLEQADMQAERRQMIAMLLPLLGDVPAALDSPLASLPPVSLPADLAARVEQNNQALLQARLATDAARIRLRMARLEQLPELAFSVGVGVSGEGMPAILGGVGIGLPVRKSQRQQPLIQAASLEVDAAGAQEEEVRLMVRAQVLGLQTAFERDSLALDRLEKSLLPQALATLEADRTEYLAGGGDFAGLVMDVRMWLELRRQLAERTADRFVTWAQAMALAGEKPGGKP